MHTNLRCIGAHKSATSPCPKWCARRHPTAYHESAPLFTWEKTPGDVRTVTAVRFIDVVADRMPAANWVAVKGGERPIMFTVEEAHELAAIVGAALPGIDYAQKQAAEFLAA